MNAHKLVVLVVVAVVGGLTPPRSAAADPAASEPQALPGDEYVGDLVAGKDPCSIWFPSAPHVGDLPFTGRKGVVIGDAAAYCPGYSPITLTVCLEYGPAPAPVTTDSCAPWPSRIDRVDGYAVDKCAPGVWRAYALVTFAGGAISQDAHGPETLIEPQACLPPPELAIVVPPGV